MLPLFTLNSQKGYIGAALIVFMVVFALLIYPNVFPVGGGPGGLGGFCADPPLNAGLIDAPSYVTDSTYQVDGEGNRGGFIDSVLTGPETKYKMIKANVPIIDISDDWFHFKADPLISTDTQFGKRQFLWPTAISGIYKVELADQTQTPDIVFHDYGIVFLQHVNADGSVRTVRSGELDIPVTDVYKDANKPDLPYQDLFECREYPLDGQFSEGFSNVISPNQDSSPDKDELQMEWFLFDKSPFKAAIMYSGCKPAVYLYPEEKQLVNVKVYPRGFLTYVDPVYDLEKGWTVTAYPDGTLRMPNIQYPIPNAQYDYLYYESKILNSEIKKPKEGFVRKFEELEGLYKEILPRLGLNGEQTSDFIEYWKKALPYSPYYFVGIIPSEEVDIFERLEIYPQPDFVNRVRVYFEKLEFPIETLEPSFATTKLPDRGFRVVEWGGMVKSDPTSPFTCSQ